MQTYIPTIGLEVHAELKTKSKMFCGCANAPHTESPNLHTCPVCLAHPGTLPTINTEAVRQVLRVGVAVGGVLADFTEFDRKNYFYPDIPKNYQISQYKYPLVSGGCIGSVAITRIHLEEDTARSIHVGEKSLVDFNRAGVPLMELVTEPVIHSGDEVLVFARELWLLLRMLGASDANLERGEMRVEVNISLAIEGAPLGTKVEIKNLNSFRAAEQAVHFEIERQTALLENGEKVIQETRGWDEARQKTVSQRKKENSNDYRYFPDPDLPKLFLSEIDGFGKDMLAASLPELPWDIRKRYLSEGMQASVASMLLEEDGLRSIYEKCIAIEADRDIVESCRNYLISDVMGWCSKHKTNIPFNFDVGNFISLLKLGKEGKLSSRGIKDVLERWLSGECREDPCQLVAVLGLTQVSDEKVLEEVVLKVVKDFPEVVQTYLEGKETVLQFLVGQCMRMSKGAGNPTMFLALLKKKIVGFSTEQ